MTYMYVIVLLEEGLKMDLVLELTKVYSCLTDKLKSQNTF